MSTNQEEIERGRRILEGGKAVAAKDLVEGDEVLGVGVMEADAIAAEAGRVTLYVAGCVYDVRADNKVTVAT